MVSFNRGAIICTTQKIEHKLGWDVQHTTQGYTCTKCMKIYCTYEAT